MTEDGAGVVSAVNQTRTRSKPTVNIPTKTSTPTKTGNTRTHLDVAVREQVLHQRAVRAGHAGVVDGEAVGQQVAQVRVLARLSLSGQDLTRRAARVRVGVQDLAGVC